jgi:hypothetical protein
MYDHQNAGLNYNTHAVIMANKSIKDVKKVKLSYTHHAGAKGERRYSSYSFLTSALDGGELSASLP